MNRTRKLTLALAALSLATITSASAAEYTYAFPIAPIAAVSLATQLDTICTGALVKSTAAQAACTTGAMPKLVKDGSKFANTGLGAEFNALLNQVPAAIAAN